MMDNIDYRDFTLRLSQLKGLGPKTFQNLLEEYKDINGIYSNQKEIPLKGLSAIWDYDISEVLAKKDINYVCVWEDTYPQNLKQISDPPVVLFYRGDLRDSINVSLSIVGTRDLTEYGKKYTKKFSEELANKGFTIISGMAFGIDRVAHESCLRVDGYTVAVLASSVDEPTPMNNTDLYNMILEKGGLILSETAPGTKMSPGLFPNRNRIIAGLSLGTLVVEAGDKSGSLITANLASGYGRDVFAIPSSLDDSKFSGSNKLIRDNKAKLVMSSEDILVEYGYLQNVEEISPTQKKNLSLHEEEIYNSILSGPKLSDEIAGLTKKNIQEVISICSVLEIKGVISRGEDNKFYIS